MIVQDSYWSTPLSFLKGMGPLRAEWLKKELGIETFGELLEHYPFRYIDRTRFYKISEIDSELPFIQIIGKLTHKDIVGASNGKRLIAAIEDETGVIELVWFQAIRYVEKSIVLGETYIVFGRPSRFNDRLNMVHPEMELRSAYKPSANAAFQPVYHSTERLKKLGLDSAGLLKMVQQILSTSQLKILETLPSPIIQKYRLESRPMALAQVHFPDNAQRLTAAITRIKFEELFFLQLKVLRVKEHRNKYIKGQLFPIVGPYFHQFFEHKLPFQLTDAQKRVMHEIRADTLKGIQMNRLLQGDVGSGKTIIALMTILIAKDNGYQSFLMAPTEILAQQHAESFKQLLGDDFLHFALLTGSTPKKKRKTILIALEDGTLDLLVGTHALLEDSVQPKNLGMVVIDEQHRFGVAQRSKLWAKNEVAPHILVMTATPIPRTLSMTVYGDLDISVLDELPKGRKPIITLWFTEPKRLRVIGLIREQIAKGRQVYVVYPLIEESSKLDYLNLFSGFEQLERVFAKPDYHISIVHGRMSAKDKDFEMVRFSKKETQLLVATTVIEVGVNIPNATVMVIESAERFGLSTLHQLRGRVGRGGEQSFCILMSGQKLSTVSKARLETMVRTQDGFEIAEMDMTLRGPGDIEGTQQSGVLDLKLANIAKDAPLLQEARLAVVALLASDPALGLEENRPLFNYRNTARADSARWDRIS